MNPILRQRVLLLLCFAGLLLVGSGASCKGFGVSKKSGGGGSTTVAFSASQSTLAVSAVSGGGGLASPTLTIKNPNAAAANYVVTTNQSWLVVTPSSGALGADEEAVINVYVNAGGLTAGTHTATVIVTNPGAPGAGATQIFVTVIVTGSGSAPTVTSPPASVTVDVGQPATFAVAVSGSVTLTYQWQKNGVDILGATNSFYTTPPATMADNGAIFRAIVTNGFGSVISAGATLTVNAAGVAPTVLTQPATQSVAAGTTANFSVTATGTAPLTFQWQKNGVNIAGATAGSYTTPVLALADSGSTYRVVVANSFGSTTSASATLTVTAAGVAPTITVQPQTTTVYNQSMAVLTVTATGTAPLSYQWYLLGHSSDWLIPGATQASYTATTADGSSGTAYRVKVSNAYGTATSDYATVFYVTTLEGPKITTQPISQSVPAGQSATFTVVASGTAPLQYQWQLNGVDIGGAVSASYTTPTLTALDHGNQYRAIVTNTYGSATSASATVTINATAGDFHPEQTSLSFTVVQGAGDPAAQSFNLHNLGSAALNWTASSNRSWLTMSPMTGTTVAGTPTLLTFNATQGVPTAWVAWPAGGSTPSKRETFSTVWTGTEMIIWGGWDQNGVRGDGYRYTPGTNTWTAISAVNAPSARNSHVAVWTGTRMVVWGGYDAQGNYVNTGGRYDPATDSWSATAMSTVNSPTPRRFASAVWTGSEMIVWGGADNWNGVSTGGRYNPATNSWSATATSLVNAPSGRTAHTAIWTGSEMLVWGGTSNLGETDALGDGGRYNPATDSWSTTPIATTGAAGNRFGHVAVWTGNRMIVWGGSADLSTRLNDGAIYDPTSNTWTGPTPTTGAPAIRHHHGAVWTGDEVLVWGGYYGTSGGSHVWLNDGGRMNLTGPMDPGVYTGQVVLSDPTASDNPMTVNVTFTVLAPSGSPLIAANPGSLNFSTAPGVNPAAQTVDLTNVGPIGSLLRWTAATQKPWFQVSPSGDNLATETDVVQVNAVAQQVESWGAATGATGAPTARENFSLVWTGTRMILWGGFDGAVLNSGAIYNPATDSWTPMSTTGAPGARRYHSAVWTGSRMIVWGGCDSADQALNSGALYDPVTDSWTGAVNLTGAPGVRRSHSAVWTGTEMIVWGGLDKIDVGSGGIVLTDGKRYNPQTNTWSVAALPTSNAPTSRYAHKAVWTGTEMLVWSGYNTIEGYVNSGGRFNPATNAWSATPISTTGAPSVRAYPMMAWTGAEMLAWGGTLGGPGLQSGGRYNPATNSWNPMTTTGAPGGAREGEGIWTGRDFMVWGGNSGGGFLSDGRRYQPPINLAAGSYTDNLTIHDPLAGNSPVTVALTLTVAVPVFPSIGLNPTTLTFNTVTGSNPAAQTVDLTNPTASSVLNWTAISDKPWLQATPFSGSTTTGTSVLTVNAIASQTEAWTGATTTTGAPSGRDNASMIWTGKEMIVWGGYNGTNNINTGGRYNPLTNTWTNMSVVNAPTARRMQGAVWTGSRIIVWGGLTDALSPLNDGYLYDPATDSWSGPIATLNAPSARRSFSAIWTGTEMVVWGGYNETTPFNDGGRYNPVNNTWAAGGLSIANAPSARWAQATVWTGTEMIVWGGYDGSYTNTGGRYNPGTDTWSASAISTTGAPAGQANPTGVWTGSEMIVWGGANGVVSTNQGGCYNPFTDTWTSSTTLAGAPTARTSHTAVWTGQEMIVWGGGEGGAWFNTGYRYRPAINLGVGTYTANLTVRDPLASNNPQSVAVTFNVVAPTPPSIALNPTTLTFNTLIGSNPSAQTVDVTNPMASSVLNWTVMSDKPWLQATPFSGSTTTGISVLTVNAIASQTEAWTGATTTTGAASARENHSLIWTGKEMIVWGGFDGSNLANGARYNPATDSWVSMSTLNQPVSRRHHTAIWTGSRMIVWGGFDGGSNLNDGAIYDPITDSWSAISSTNAPSQRREHSAVWSGAEMIVWGGLDSGPLGDGGRYNPSSDSWSLTPITAVGAPVARYEHSAVWTGAEMIVWGGLTNSTTTVNTGARYHPGSNAWTGATSIIATAAARQGHAAVFNGTHMIVWGGETAGGASNINTGGIYDVATDTWIGATTLTGAPSARRSLRGVWTGTEMITWGGNSGSYQNTGAKYRPAINLGVGTYTANLTVRDPLASNNPQSVAVTFNVVAPTPPSIALNPATLTFNTVTGVGPAAQTVDLTNPAVGSTLNWSLSVDQPWLNVAPTAGSTTTGTSVLTVTAQVQQSDGWPSTTTTVGAPSVREAMSTVWTGSEMIVWGGWADAVIGNGGIYNPATNSWRSMSTTGAPVVAKHVAVWTGSKMVVWGGMDSGSGYVNTGAIYDPATDVWTGPTSTVNAPSGRWHPTVAWTGTEMIVWSGQTSGGYVNDGGRYNPATDTWNATAMSTVNAPTGRVGSAGVWTGSELIVWGGTSDGGATGLNSGGRYTPGSNSWSLTPPTAVGAPTARYHHTAVWDGSRMIVWGGSSGLSTRLNDGALYDPASDAWTAATATAGAPAIRHGHGAVWIGNAMIVWGGWWGSTGPGHLRFNDGARYRPPLNLAVGSYSGTVTVHAPLAGNNPQQISVTLNVAALTPPIINLSQTTLNFSGGVGGPDPVAQTVQLTNPSLGTTLNWTATPNVSWLTVSPMSGATSSGTTILTIQPQLGSSEAWTTTTSATGAPSIREGHCAVWTGTQMLIWGGNPGTGGLNTGGRYNVGTDSWQSLNNTGAPTARHQHSAVWTGSRMVVFGGDDGFGTMATTGGVYDPASNSWSGMSMVNAPVARRGHKAIWTGSEMIVWGGFLDNGTTVTNDGARYNPATDTWNPTPISTANAPSARAYHSAIWTGTEMIVWGGYDTANLLSDGYRYNPATDSWNPTPISSVGAPTARDLHSAVWTGRQMVIWGGDQNALQTANWDTGSIYEPATDSWTGATSLTGVPTARHNHSAIWTGSQMIVWGGWKANTNTFLNDGKRYTPPPLPAGSYSGQVTVSDPAASNNPQTIDVNLTVAQPSLGVSSNAIVYDVTSADIPTFTIQNTTAGTISYTVASDQSWLIAPPAGTVTAGTPVTILPNLYFITMAPGSYTANLTITAPGAVNSPQTVSVTMIVGAVDSFETGASYLRDLYVAETGNDTTGDGTLGNPYRTPAKALAVALPGDHIHVLAGTFPGHIAGYAYALGTYANPIKISGDSAGGTLIDCAGAGNGLYGSGLQFLIVENLEIINFSVHGISFDGNINGRGRGHHLIVRNIKVHNPQTTAVDCIKLNNTDTSAIERCDVSLNGTLASGSNTISTRFCYHTVIRHNYVHDSTLFGIRFGSDSRDNLAYANRISNLNDRGINLTGMRNAAIANVLTNVKNPLAFESAEEPLAANNTIYLGGQFMLWFSRNAIEPTESRNGRIVNNIFVFNNANLTNYCNNGANTFPATFQYQDNLWYSLDTPGFAGPTNTAAAETGALYQVNPLFVNAAVADYHLQAGSGARGNGLAVAQAPKDYDGVAFASPPARGAFEGLAGPVAALSLAPTTINLNATAGNSVAPAQTSNVSNVGASGSILNWTATGTQPWLRLSPGGGSIASGLTALQISAAVTQTEAWTGAMPTLFAPTGSEDFTAVWTGREMLVWGGFNGSTLNTGARFNPVTNVWTALPTGGAPAARRMHTGVWTGKEMIVWGGLNSAGVALNDGARFNPVLNAWVGTTALTGAPGIRRTHTAVWTGTEMIVWGGYDQGGATMLNDGKRYNPSTDSWTAATSLTNAPTARYTHAAVWTGSEMIVWGGYDGGYIQTGGRYTPGTDTWSATPMATAGAPSARGVASAVWTGTEMILWGGTSTGSNVLNDGARYNPTANSWSAPLETVGQPTGRRSHNAVWTGKEMLVWGGHDGAGYIATGGRYAPPLGLAAGVYTDTVTVRDPAASASPQTIAVTLTVVP